MAQPIHIVSLSEAGNPSVKDNEDSFADRVSGERFGAVVCDGVSQRCRPNENYPGLFASEAAHRTVNSLVNLFETEGHHTVDTVMQRLHVATTEMLEYNTKRERWNIADWTLHDRSATTMVCAIGQRTFDGRLNGYVMSLGDPLAIAFGASERPLILARDQLVQSRRWRRQQGWDKTKQAAWSRGTARNNVTLRSDGVALGYGTLDGNRDFMHFVETRPFSILPGGTLLLASDAMRVLGSEEDSDNPDSYQYLQTVVEETPLEDLPAGLITLIREQEVDRRAKRDDATVVAIRN